MPRGNARRPLLRGEKGPSPLFRKAPHVLFQLSSLGKLMARGYYSMYRNVLRVVDECSAAENDGVAQYLNRVQAFLEDPGVVADPRHQVLNFIAQSAVPNLEYLYKIPILPRSGYFVVLMRPPCSWGSSRDREDLKFLYRLDNLYLEGFWYEDLLWVFRDTDLSGVLTAAEEQLWVRRLSFKGGYIHGGLEANFYEVKLGGNGFFNTYKTLKKYRVHTKEQVQEALTRMATGVSEAVRFPHLQINIERACLTGVPWVIDVPKKVFSRHFNQWDSYGDAIREDVDGNNTELLDLVGILKSRPGK